MTDPTPDLNRILDNATVIHLQPDDVLVFSNAGDLGAETEDLERLKAIVGDRTTVVFHGPVDIERLRDIAPCAACEERKREEDAATEQWKQEFMARHGLLSGGIIEPPEGHVPDPIVIDLRHEGVFTAEQIRNDPLARASLDEINREVATDQQGDAK